VEIMESTETPGIYRVMNAYSNSVYPYAEDDCAEEGTFLEVNAEDPQGVYVAQQSLGFDWGYGEMSFVTNGARYLANYSVEELKGYGYLGTVADGMITFPTFAKDPEDESKGIYQGVVFLGSDGYYCGGNGKIEITLPTASTFAKSMAKAKANITRHAAAKRLNGTSFNKGKDLMQMLRPSTKPFLK